MSSIPPKLETLPFVTIKPSRFDKNRSMFDINPDKMDKTKVHTFFFEENANSWLVASLLQYQLFHPSTSLSEKFTLRKLTVKGYGVMQLSFPKEYEEVCERAARIYDMKYRHLSRYMNSTPDICIHLPTSPHLFILQGRPSEYNSATKREIDTIKTLCEIDHRMGVD